MRKYVARSFVTAEDFVRAFADLDHDRSRVARQFRNVIERHANRIRDRLVLMKDESGRNSCISFSRDDHFVMVGAKLLRDAPRAIRARSDTPHR